MKSIVSVVNGIEAEKKKAQDLQRELELEMTSACAGSSADGASKQSAKQNVF